MPEDKTLYGGDDDDLLDAIYIRPNLPLWSIYLGDDEQVESYLDELFPFFFSEQTSLLENFKVKIFICWANVGIKNPIYFILYPFILHTPHYVTLSIIITICCWGGRIIRKIYEMGNKSSRD